VTVSELRTGIATNLATISGLRTSAFVPDNPTPPIAVVVPQRIEYDAAMNRGMDTYMFDVLVIAQRMSERNAQSLLDGYCNPTGSSSVKTALETDTTLGGKAFDLRVTEMSNYQALTIGDTQYLAATFSVTVITAT
jgi:hypothetical protein